MTKMRQNLEEFNKQIREKQKSENYLWRREIVWKKCLEIRKEIQDLIKRDDVIGVGYGPKSLNLKEFDIPEIKIHTKGEVNKNNRIKPISEFEKKKLDLPKEVAGIKTKIEPCFFSQGSMSQCSGMDILRHQDLKPGRNIGVLNRNKCATLGMKVWDKNNSSDTPENELTEYFLTCNHGFETIGLKVYQPGYPQIYYSENEIGEVVKTYDSIASGYLCEVSLVWFNKIGRTLENLPISRSMPYDAEIGKEVNIQSASYLEYMSNPQSLYAKGRIAYVQIYAAVYNELDDTWYELETQYAIEPQESGEEICKGGTSGAVFYDNFGTAIAMHSGVKFGGTINTSFASGLNIPALSHNVFDALDISPTPYGSGTGRETIW